MASKYDKEREKLGLRTSSSKSTSNSSSSKYAAERERLYSGAAEKEKKSVQKELMTDTLSGPEFLRESPTVNFNSSLPAQVALPSSPSQLLKQQNEQGRFSAPVRQQEAEAAARQQQALNSPLTRFAQGAQDLITKATQPIRNLLPKPKTNTVGMRALQALGEHRSNVQQAQSSTALGRFAGGVGDAATLGLAPYVERMLGNGDVADANTRTTAGKIGNIAGQVLLPAGKLKAGASVFSNIGRGALAGGLLGAGIEAGEGLTNRNNQSLGQRALDVGVSAALGGAGAGAIEGVTKGLQHAKGVADKLLGDHITQLNAIESAAKSVPTTGRLRVSNNNENLDRVMKEIKPIVTERMTPPLENPNELAKWIQPKIGNVSLNEIRKLSYDDMLELATEAQRKMNVYDVAQTVAKERGYNLDSLLNKTAPTLPQAAERLRLGGVAGAIEPPKNVRVALGKSEPFEVSENSPSQSYKEPWFNKLFGSQSVGITAGNKSAKELIDTHIVSSPKETGSLIAKAKDAADLAKQDYVDQFTPFQKIDQATYDAAMDSNRANNLANVTIKDKFVDLEGNVKGNSLKDVYGLVLRGQKNLADRYVILRDAVNRMDRGKAVYGKEAWFPQTSEAAQEMVNNLEARNPWLTAFGNEWNKFNRNRQDLWVESGIASKDLIEKLRYTNPNYAPMFRQKPKAGLGSNLAINSGKAGFSGQKAPVKRAVGSTAKIIEPAQGMIETTASSYNAMMRNRAMVKLYDAVNADPERFKGVLEIVDDSADMTEAALKEINKALAENGPDGVADYLNAEVNDIFKKAKQSATPNESVVTVMLDGVPKKMKVSDPSLLKAIEGINPQELEGLMKVANGISRAIKHSATGVLAPLQGIRLAARDLPIALTQSKDKKRFLFDITHAMASQIGDWLPHWVPGSETLGKLARDYYRAGGGYEAFLKGDSRIRATSKDITRDPLLSRNNLLKTAKKVNPLKPFKEFGDAMENIPRIAAYAAEMRKAGWNRTPENVRRAVDAGREATVNWSRKGAKSRGIEAVFPYTNAAVQGTYRIAKRFKEQPIAATALIASLAGAKIASYEKFKDDPEYQTRSKYEKGIPVYKTKSGKFVSIPVEPTEAYIADQLLNFYKWAKDGEKIPDAKENIQSGLEATLPTIASGPASAFTTQGKLIALRDAAIKTVGGSIGDPISALTTGKNFFGSDIVPREYQGKATSVQNDETTSAAGKWASEHLGIDAFTFDYLGEKLGGDIAKIALPLTSDVGKGDIKGNIVDQVNARLKLLEDPIMKNNIADDYYNYVQKVSDAKDISDKKMTNLPDWYQTAYDQVTSMKKGSINKMVSELNGEKKDIQHDTTLTAKQRADKLRDIQSQINMLRIQGIKRLEELGVNK